MICSKKRVKPGLLPSAANHKHMHVQVVALSDESAAVDDYERVSIARDLGGEFMGLSHEEAHDRKINAGVIRVARLMAENKAMLA